ncbi:hypothetical protein ACQKJG_18450 [Priestia megaterium]|uniref:hypothetical protein n=1 Tax=Priestia megaterium TaxID=1404 RepID=UPI003D025D72
MRYGKDDKAKVLIKKVNNLKTYQMEKGVIYENASYGKDLGKRFKYARKTDEGYLEVSNDLKYWTMINVGKISIFPKRK